MVVFFWLLLNNALIHAMRSLLAKQRCNFKNTEHNAYLFYYRHWKLSISVVLAFEGQGRRWKDRRICVLTLARTDVYGRWKSMSRTTHKEYISYKQPFVYSQILKTRLSITSCRKTDACHTIAQVNLFFKIMHCVTAGYRWSWGHAIFFTPVSFSRVPGLLVLNFNCSF